MRKLKSFSSLGLRKQALFLSYAHTAAWAGTALIRFLMPSGLGSFLTTIVAVFVALTGVVWVWKWVSNREAFTAMLSPRAASRKTSLAWICSCHASVPAIN